MIYETIIEITPIKIDYILHFFIGGFLWWIFQKISSSPWIFLIVIAVGKEVFDFLSYGGYDPADLAFSALGPAFLVAFQEFKNIKENDY